MAGETENVKMRSPLTGFAPPYEHRFRKGKSGNPRGYSRDRRRRDALIRLMDPDALIEFVEAMDPASRKKKMKLLAEALFARSMAGDIRATKLIIDTLDGPPER